MKYTKIFREETDTVGACAQITSNTYCNTFEHIQNMVNVLKADFAPQRVITDDCIQVHKYGGSRMKNISFVEVFAKGIVPPTEDYQIVKQIECIL